MKRKALVIGLGYLMVALLGCGTQPMQSLEPICVPSSDVQAAMDSAEQVLGQMHFAIDKSDPKQGYIRTKPLTGAQLFEFWRKDTVGQFNTAESNIHTVRRTVEINVSQKNGRVCTDCVVTAERISLPQRDASALFTRSSPSLQQEGMTWIELGRDSRLEAEILSRLRAKL